MALESVFNSATHKEYSRPVQQGNVKSTAVQHMNSGNNVVIGTAENTTAIKALVGQEDETNQSTQQKYDPLANAKRLKSAITQANNKMKQTRTRCEFSYHEETHRVSIKVFDKDTQEVIREIPPEESLEMLEKVWDIAGLLVDERR